MSTVASKLLAVALTALLLGSTVYAQQSGGSSAREARKNGERLQNEAQKRAKRAQRDAQRRQKQSAKDIKRQHKERLRETKRKTKERERQGREVESQFQKKQPDAPPKRRARPPADGKTDPLERLRQYGNESKAE